MTESQNIRGSFSKSDSVKLGKRMVDAGFSVSKIVLYGVGEAHCGIMAYNAQYSTFKDYDARSEQDYLLYDSVSSYTFDWSGVTVYMHCQDAIRLILSSDSGFFWELSYPPHQQEAAKKFIAIIKHWLSNQ